MDEEEQQENKEVKIGEGKVDIEVGQEPSVTKPKVPSKDDDEKPELTAAPTATQSPVPDLERRSSKATLSRDDSSVPPPRLEKYTDDELNAVSKYKRNRKIGGLSGFTLYAALGVAIIAGVASGGLAFPVALACIAGAATLSVGVMAVGDSRSLLSPEERQHLKSYERKTATRIKGLRNLRGLRGRRDLRNLRALRALRDLKDLRKPRRRPMRDAFKRFLINRYGGGAIDKSKSDSAIPLDSDTKGITTEQSKAMETAKAMGVEGTTVALTDAARRQVERGKTTSVPQTQSQGSSRSLKRSPNGRSVG